MNINFKKKFLFSFLFLLILSLGSVFATPSITINPLITNDTTPVISGNFDLDGATLSSIAVIIDGNTYGTAFGTITATGTDWSIPNISTLTEGTYEVAATLTTGIGTFGDNTNNELTIDTTSPVVDVGADVTSNSLFTKDATVTDTTSLTYLWEDVTVEGAGTITFGSSTSQDTTISANTDGIYTIRLTATDAAGNDSSFDEFTLTWDETLPSGYSVSIDQSYINDSNKDALSFTFIGAEVGTTYNYSIDDGNEDTSAITNTGTIATASDQITGIDVSTLSDDTLTLTLTLTDLAGNVGVGVTDIITKDTTSPVVDVGANVISNETITKDATVTDTTSLTYLWEDVTVEGAGIITFGNSISQDTTISANIDGIYTIRLTATDAAGNDSSFDEFTLTWDETLPSGYSVSIDQSYINDSNKDALSFTFIDAEVGTTYNYSINDENEDTSAITNTGTIATASDQITGINVSTLSDDTLTLTLTLTDLAGNVGVDVTDTITKDIVSPVILSVTSNALENGVLGIGDSIIFTVDIETSEENLILLPITYNGGVLNWTTEDGGDTYTATYTVEVGQEDQLIPLQLLGVNATDVSGNTSISVDGSDVNKTIDINPPEGYSVSIDQSYINDSNKDALSFTFTYAEVGTTYNYSIDDENEDTSAITNTGIIATASDQITGIDVSTLSDGILTLTVNLIDSVNNQGLDVTDTVTKDTILPTMISATKDSETQITITMSEIISTNETNPTDFIVTDSANQTFVVSSQLDNIGVDNLLVLTTSNMSSSIGNLTVTYNKTDSSVLDVSGNEFTSDAIGIILDSVNYVSLVHGYNFFALPKNATNNTVSSVFNNIESTKVIYDFNKTTGLFTALDSSDKLIPLNGYIVNLIGNGSAKITYDTTILNYPGAKELTAGWNLIGNTNTSTTNILDILAGCISPNNGYYWDNTIQFDSTTQNYNLAVIAGNASNVSVGESFWINIKNGESCTIAALTN